MSEIERELNWDDEITKDSDFILLPEGDYDFKVTGFERARHNGSEKLPPCAKAVVTLEISAPEGVAYIKHNLFLHTKCEGLLSNFFTGIGQKKHGETLKMNWGAVVGSTGRCKVAIRHWKNSNTGENMQSNEVKKFYEPAQNPQNNAHNYNESGAHNSGQNSGVFTPGKF